MRQGVEWGRRPHQGKSSEKGKNVWWKKAVEKKRRRTKKGMWAHFNEGRATGGIWTFLKKKRRKKKVSVRHEGWAASQARKRWQWPWRAHMKTQRALRPAGIQRQIRGDEDGHQKNKEGRRDSARGGTDASESCEYLKPARV